MNSTSLAESSIEMLYPQLVSFFLIFTDAFPQIRELYDMDADLKGELEAFFKGLLDSYSAKRFSEVGKT